MLQDEASETRNFSPDPDQSGESVAEERLQYTIKGIERKSLELMRDAARQDGMKIGAWVSMRMREAAEASLLEPKPAYQKRFEEGLRTGHLSDSSQVSLSEVLRRLDDLHSKIESLGENQRALISGLLARSRD